MKDFFISYNQTDKAYAEWIAWQLEAAGYSTVIQAWDFRPGHDFVLKMHEAAKETERTIAVLSPNYLAAEFVHPEWTAAFAKDPKGERGLLIFVRVRECEPEGMTTARIYVDLLGLDEAAAKERLLAGVKPGRVKPERPPLFPKRSAAGPGWPGATSNSIHGGVSAPPHKPRHLPYDSIGDLFKGRDELLINLHERLRRAPGSAAALVAKHAIHGLGGVGKTRLAVEYALRHGADYSALLFVLAETPEALRRNLAGLGESGILSLPEREAKEEEVRLRAVLDWLADHPGWLLILDNADSPEAVAAIEAFLPQFHGGHVLVTSRIEEWSPAVDSFAVDVLGEPDAVAFLLERTDGHRRRTPSDDADVRALAKELGGLALALEQAGAFISKVNCSLGDYLRRWRGREAKVRTWHDANIMKYPKSVAVTWDTTFEQLGAPGRALLRLLCWFAPEPIPRAIFETEAARTALKNGVESIRAANDAPAVDAETADVEDALASLKEFSLLKWEPDGAAFRVHRLVAEVTRERLPEANRATWLTAAAGVMDDYLPGDPPPHDVRSWPLWRPAQAHAAGLIAFAEQCGVAGLLSGLTDNLAVFLYANGVWREAESLFRRALAIDEKSSGPDHPDVAIRLNNLAQLLKATNRSSEAEPLMRRALAIDEHSYGPVHPNVAIRLNNLAMLLHATNRLSEAEPLMRRALVIDQERFGPDHPEVAIDLNNLALLLKATNRLSEAEPLMRRALAIDEERFGPDHPKVATRLNNLVLLLNATNRLGEAEPLMRRALAIDEKSYGPDHPDVAIRLNNLAQLLKATNRLGEAEPLMRRALAMGEKSFGPDHPNVAVRLNNLAALLQATNRVGEAEPLMRRALAIDEQSAGPDHPNMARDLNDLSLLLQVTNRLDEAHPMMRRALEIRCAFTRDTGHEHPDLRATIRNYSSLLEKMGHNQKETAAKLAEILGPFGIKPDGKA